MQPWLRIVPAVVSVAACCALAQAPAEPLIKHTFKQDESGWTVFGQSAMVSVTHEPALVMPGAGALKLGYDIAKGQMNALVLPVQLGSLATAKSIKFRVRADANTVVSVMLSEQDGGHYTAMCMAPKDSWQPIELSTADFSLAQDPGDPKDPDDKLDMDQVSGIVIVDGSQFFAQIDNPALAGLFDLRTGAHVLYIDDFTVVTDPIQPGWSHDAGGVAIDTFSHPQLSWFGIGGVQLSHTSGAPLDGPGIKAEYRQQPSKFEILSRGVVTGALAGMKTLSFDAASEQDAKLVVQVEETDGGKYKANVEIPGGSQVKHLSVAFTDMVAADDSKDENGKLDVEKIKSVVLVDYTGPADQAYRLNTLLINNLRAAP